MYCSKCGEADQSANSYCRKCGYYLRSQKVISLVLIMNFMALGLSLIMLIMLLAIYLTGSEGSFPNTINNTYVAFGSIALIQICIITPLIVLLVQTSGVSSKSGLPSEDINSELTGLGTKDLLPPADFQNLVPSVVEKTTKNLSKVGRK